MAVHRHQMKTEIYPIITTERRNRMPPGASPRPKCIVLPLPTVGDAPDAAGLGLHFLLGNMMAAHPGLSECWFGWRMPRIFHDPTQLIAFCNGNGPNLDLTRTATDLGVRFWIRGEVDAGTARLIFFDADVAKEMVATVPLESADGWVAFRKAVLDLLHYSDGLGRVTDPAPMLWVERCSCKGLDAVGRALLSFYVNSAKGTGTSWNIAPFLTAMADAPESFLAPALAGWAWYKSGRRAEAIAAFQQAITRNPAGVGSLAGLVQCAVASGNAAAAAGWARRKAIIRGENPHSAVQRARRKAAVSQQRNDS